MHSLWDLALLTHGLAGSDIFYFIQLFASAAAATQRLVQSSLNLENRFACRNVGIGGQYD